MVLKRQTGIWVDGEVWQAYRELCSRERLRPGGPVEEFVRFVVRDGSALTVVNMMREMEEEKAEGFEAYARVLLNWYTHGRHFVSTGGEEDLSVEEMLLKALKEVSDQQLRREIEEALTIKDRKKRARKEDEKGADLVRRADDLTKRIKGESGT